jgi:hypothetical protein
MTAIRRVQGATTAHQRGGADAAASVSTANGIHWWQLFLLIASLLMFVVKLVHTTSPAQHQTAGESSVVSDPRPLQQELSRATAAAQTTAAAMSPPTLLHGIIDTSQWVGVKDTSQQRILPAVVPSPYSGRAARTQRCFDRLSCGGWRCPTFNTDENKNNNNNNATTATNDAAAARCSAVTATRWHACQTLFFTKANSTECRRLGA